jgi:curved DNA-binding protein
MENYYQTLGVNENANPEEIKRAYRKLAAQHHPDKGGDTAQFQRIQKAYETLGDQNNRARYDAERQGMGGFRFNINGQEFGGAPPGMDDIFRNFGFSFGPGGFNHGDPFGQFRQPRRNKDIRVELHIDIEDTLQGRTQTVEIQTAQGKTQTVEVNIPRGIHHGSSIKYPGLGDNFFDSMPRGDLYVTFVFKPHARFEVHNHIDLVLRLDINALDAIIGIEQEYMSIDGKRYTITIPAGTQHDAQFRVPGQGLYIPNQNNRGMLYIVARIVVPTHLDSKQVESIRQILGR